MPLDHFTHPSSGMVTIPELTVPSTGTGIAEQRRAARYAAQGDHQMAAAYFRLAAQMATRAGRDSAALRAYLKYKAHRRLYVRAQDLAAAPRVTEGRGR